MEIGAGETAEVPTAVDLALAACETSFDDLLKLVEDGGLQDHDDAALVGLMQRFERLRNRQALVDHRFVRDGQARRLPDLLTQPSMTSVLVWALRLSRGEAARRVRAAEEVSERTAATGQPLVPLRPALAAVQRTGQATPEQIDICLRALAKIDHRGFDPADIDAAEELLAGHTLGFAPKELAVLAARVVDRVDPDGSLPQDTTNAARRHFTMRKARDGMVTGEFRLTGLSAPSSRRCCHPWRHLG